MRISISTNIDKVLPRFSGFSNQFRFAVAKALTDTAWETSKKLKADMQTYIDRPNPFTMRSLFVERATKQSLTSVVGIRDKQATYLRWVITGGLMSPLRKATRLPTGVKTNKYGNIPKSYIAKIIDKSKIKAKGNRVSYFYGKPRGSNRPVGLYKRTRRGGLESLVAFTRNDVLHKSRFKFFELSKKHIKSCIDRNLQTAWKRAVSSSY